MYISPQSVNRWGEASPSLAVQLICGPPVTDRAPCCLSPPPAIQALSSRCQWVRRVRSPVGDWALWLWRRKGRGSASSSPSMSSSAPGALEGSCTSPRWAYPGLLSLLYNLLRCILDQNKLQYIDEAFVNTNTYNHGPMILKSTHPLKESLITWVLIYSVYWPVGLYVLLHNNVSHIVIDYSVVEGILGMGLWMC